VLEIPETNDQLSRCVPPAIFEERFDKRWTFTGESSWGL